MARRWPDLAHSTRWGIRHAVREPPVNVLPGASDIALVLARTEAVAVLVHEVGAWAGGFRFTLRVRVRPGSEAAEIEDPLLTYEPYARRRWQHHRAVPPEQLRIGLELPDGSQITNLAPGSPPGPILTENSGRGASGEWVYLYAVYPLPERGRIGFLCEWPAFGISVTRVDVDASALLEAARRAVTIW